jgi:hypothetical protein
MSDVEERLQADGRRWQNEIDQAAARPAPADRPGRRWGPILAAVAVMAVVGVVGVPLVMSDHRQQAGPSGSPGQSPSAASSTPVPTLVPQPTGSPTPDARNPQPYSGPAAIPAVTVPSAQIPTTLSMQWRLLSVGSDDRTLDILGVAGDGACVIAAGVQVVESAASVEVSMRSHWDQAPTACPDRLVLTRVLVTLKQPLGTRTLLHAPVSDRWSNVTPP